CIKWTLPVRRTRSARGRSRSSEIDPKKTGYTISDASPRRQRGCFRRVAAFFPHRAVAPRAIRRRMNISGPRLSSATDRDRAIAGTQVVAPHDLVCHLEPVSGQDPDGPALATERPGARVGHPRSRGGEGE